MSTINTPTGPASNRQVISYDEYLRLVGLLTLATDHYEAMLDIQRSALKITGESEPIGYTADAVWNAETAEQLLEKLGIAVAPKEEG